MPAPTPDDFYAAAGLRLDEGRYAEAEALARQGLAAAEASGDGWNAVRLGALAGEALWRAGRAAEAVPLLVAATDRPEGLNPYVLLRAGQACLDSGDAVRARRMFFAAFHLDGHAVFEDEDPRYFALIADDVPR